MKGKTLNRPSRSYILESSPHSQWIHSPNVFPPIKITVPSKDTALIPLLACQLALIVESCQDVPRSLLTHTSLRLFKSPACHNKEVLT